MAKNLLKSAKLGNLTLKNRLIRSATWEGLADTSGFMPPKLYEIYENLAKGGVGAIISGFTSVAQDDYYFGGMARLGSDDLIKQHQKLTQICHAHNCAIIAQIALGEFRGGIEPNFMSGAEICEVINLFAKAAIRAQKAGYDGVQIHAAHGFFLSRFISPAFNRRSDEYGKTPINRAKILKNIINAIKIKAPSLHISLKINCSDFMHGGLDYSQSMEICKFCAECGAQSIEISGNGTSVAGIKPFVNEAYFAEFAQNLAQIVEIPIILVGGNRSVENMERILNSTQIEFFSLSRPLIAEPNLINRWISGELAPAKCISCNTCYKTPAHECIFNIKNR